MFSIGLNLADVKRKKDSFRFFGAKKFVEFAKDSPSSRTLLIIPYVLERFFQARRIRNYSPETNAAVSFDRISISNSTLTDNTVYCFAPGSANRLWIGTENGLNYYSYQNKQLKAFTVIADGKKVKYVHSINELNDTTLWVSTVGEGIVKVILDKAIPPVIQNNSGSRFNGRRATGFIQNNFYDTFTYSGYP